MSRFSKEQVWKILIFILPAIVLAQACVEFFNVGWGTGVALGQFSLTWLILFAAFVLFCLVLLSTVGIVLWKPGALSFLATGFLRLRENLGLTRWLLTILVFVFPVYFLQFTAGGVIFQGMYMRSLIWGLTVILFASLVTKGDALIGWNQFLVALVLTSSEFMIAAEFVDVTGYPFSLGWSEGNRMWDYSMLFGKHLYDIPAGQKAEVLLDIGRQLVGGLPFLIPNLTIKMERFWIASTLTFPYLLLGLASFRANRAQPFTWIIATLWVLIFLRQGPIHPPLVLCAVLVALIWRRPLWLAIPLIAVTGYLAWANRFTWLFAPGMWIGMMELAGAALKNKKLDTTAWTRAILLGLSGMTGGFFGPRIVNLFPTGAVNLNPAVSVESTAAMASTQPLLWYRLLPNATYGYGILIALFIAVTPLIFILFHLARTKKWELNIWQALSIVAPLSAFLAVGLIVSAKIGGGGDLHNLDMFLIGLMFAGVLAWHSGGQEWIQDSRAISPTLKVAIALFLIVPALSSLRELYPYNMGEDAARLAILADAPDEKSLDMLPTQETVNIALDTIREEVALAKPKGEILFIDQRQLLTFGYITDVTLVPEYEKKVLMNEALRPNLDYFAPFYKDLAAKRFALIVSEPLRVPDKGSSYQFGEENDDWVKYVSMPALCYYEPKTTLAEVGVQLLMPKDNPGDCSDSLP